IEIRYDSQTDIPEGGGERKRTLSGLDSLVQGTHHPEVFGHKDSDLSQPLAIVQDLGEGLRLTQVVEDARLISQWQERIAEVAVQIDSLLECVLTLGEAPQGDERLLKARDRLAVARTLYGTLTRPSPVQHGLSAQACLGIVVCQQLRLGLVDI